MDIPFHKPIFPENIDFVIPDSIKDGWLTTGPQVKKFENKLSQYTISKNIIAVNSCTAALHLALAAKGFGPGDKFLVPTFTFVASVEVGEYLGMEPILVDCDEDYNINIDDVQSLLQEDSSIKAIIPVHFAGKPVNMDRIYNIAEEYDLFVLEDAAHALEAFSNVDKIGNTSHAVAFSFYANKNITTAGEGGAVATNDVSLAEKIRKLSLHGMSKDGWNRFRKGGKWEYDVSDLGYKYNMTDFSAAYGIWQLGKIDSWYKKRQSIFNKYQDNFEANKGIICPIDSNNNEKHAYHLYIIRIVPSKWTIDRNKIIELLNQEGVGTSVHYKPIHMHSYYKKKYGYKSKDFPQASAFYDNVITLPLYPSLKNSEVNHIINTVNKLWENYRK